MKLISTVSDVVFEKDGMGVLVYVNVTLGVIVSVASGLLEGDGLGFVIVVFVFV